MKMTVADIITLHWTLMTAHQLQVYFNMFSCVVTKSVPWSALHSGQSFENRVQTHGHVQVSWDIAFNFIQRLHSRTVEKTWQFTMFQGSLCVPWNVCRFLGRNNRVDRPVWVQNGHRVSIFKNTPHFPVEKQGKVKCLTTGKIELNRNTFYHSKRKWCRGSENLKLHRVHPATEPVLIAILLKNMALKKIYIMILVHLHMVIGFVCHFCLTVCSLANAALFVTS